MQRIIDLIERYIEVSDIFWNDDSDLDENFKFNQKTLEWFRAEWALMDEMDSLKRKILKLINGDRELFNKYLCLGSCLKTEDYEQAEIFKNEILNHGKIS